MFTLTQIKIYDHPFASLKPFRYPLRANHIFPPFIFAIFVCHIAKKKNKCVERNN